MSIMTRAKELIFLTNNRDMFMLYFHKDMPERSSVRYVGFSSICEKVKFYC